MDLPKITALVVEDEPQWINRYAQVLKAEQIDIVTVLSLGDALELLRKRRFDLAVVDMYLSPSRADGMDVVAAIRRNGDDTAIIVSTAVLDVDLATEGFEKFHIQKFHQKRRWNPSDFSESVKAALAQKPVFTGPSTLLKYLETAKSSEQFSHEIEFTNLVKEIGEKIEPFASNTLTPVVEVVTPAGKVVQTSGWSRSLGAMIVLRIGIQKIIKRESKQFNRPKNGPLLLHPYRPLIKHSPVYQGRLGALIIELDGAEFGTAISLATLFRNADHRKFLAGISDLLNFFCRGLQKQAGTTNETVEASVLYRSQLAVLEQRRKEHQEGEKRQFEYYLSQLSEDDRNKSLMEMEAESNAQRLQKSALGYPMRDGKLVDPVMELTQYKARLRVTFSLITEQMVANNVFVDEQNRAWPIYGGSLVRGPIVSDLADLEIDLKFGLLRPVSLETYAAFEQALDLGDPSRLPADSVIQTLYQAIIQIREFTNDLESDSHLHEFLLALGSMNVAQQTTIPELREGAEFSAAWHVNKLLM